MTRWTSRRNRIAGRLLLAALAGLCACDGVRGLLLRARRPPQEINEVARPDPARTVAIVGATLIDGRGGPAVQDATVIVRGDRILAAGPRSSVPAPAGAQIIDGAGLSVLPGLIDAHFHIDGDGSLPARFLRHGVTSLRDPGQWIEAYDDARAAAAPVPRLFLTGPHLDWPPPAHPGSALIVLDPAEARAAVDWLVDDGASAIKVYFRLPVGMIEAVAGAAHERGVPVTAHLEIADARDAIQAGLDGVEHVTSFGTALVPPHRAEAYRQAVLADNAARREGRYELWSEVSVGSPRADQVLHLLAARHTFFAPTLAVFERRPGDRDTSDVHVSAFANMMAFVGRAAREGVRVVVGSHAEAPHAARGWAYQRELELLVESGLTPMQAIVAGTLENARFLRAEHRLGTVEPGKLADLVLVEGDPLADIGAMRNIRRVMLNGVWVTPPQG